ncbi:HTH domain-containing protein [Virgibacillus chiguensis]|uniref:HTH domain-containing protein n=1 Tax=Virgibacillus chiguensis TaxID=411959 RepID=A0A1M5QMZ4_9BACI|nr:HTH domain-containing protein [Virgibacillus chiguensis]
MPKIDNMLAILWMLRSGKKITAKQISENLEINIRTVYRYIDTISTSGVPIISEPGHNGGYTLLTILWRHLFFLIWRSKLRCFTLLFLQKKLDIMEVKR